MVEWNPPSPIAHPELADLAFKAWSFDVGADMRRVFAPSGEEPTPKLQAQGERHASAREIMNFNVRVREAKKSCMENWNSSSLQPGKGRPVDAVICPVMPYAAVKIGELEYLKYTCFVNVLDYTSVVVPFAAVDKRVDERVEGFEGLGEVDKREQQKCALSWSSLRLGTSSFRNN